MNFERYTKGIKVDIKNTVFNYYATPEDRREPLKVFLKRARITRRVAYRIELLHEMMTDWAIDDQQKALKVAEEERQANIRKIQEGLLDEDDPVQWWQKKSKEINESILLSARKGNAQSQKLAKQLSGELVEKSEVKIGLNADEYFAILAEARRRFAPGGEINGDRGLLPERALLSQEIRQDKR